MLEPLRVLLVEYPYIWITVAIYFITKDTFEEEEINNNDDDNKEQCN